MKIKWSHSGCKVQLPWRLFQLVFRMVPKKEVLVLRQSEHGMPWHLAWQLPSTHLRHARCGPRTWPNLRLQRWLLQLEGRMVRFQEGLVLLAWEERMSQVSLPQCGLAVQWEDDLTILTGSADTCRSFCPLRQELGRPPSVNGRFAKQWREVRWTDEVITAKGFLYSASGGGLLAKWSQDYSRHFKISVVWILVI